MDKTLAGLIGVVGSAVGSLAAVAPAQALSVPPLADVMQAESYADLLRPIPNATAVLRAADASRVDTAPAPELMEVQYYHHHHHHHHNFYRRDTYRRPAYGYYRHHHHHHHNQYRRVFVPGVGWIVR